MGHDNPKKRYQHALFPEWIYVVYECMHMCNSIGDHDIITFNRELYWVFVRFYEQIGALLNYLSGKEGICDIVREN